MPISVTCQCGAKLEIDEKFLGKEIPCPDCNRPLPTKPPVAAVAPPPLDLPDFRRTSGLAVLSLTLAMVGAFTIVGTIAAIVVGVLALKEIAGKSGKLEGVNFARAGIVVGAVFTFITLAIFISPTALGIDILLRQVALAPRLKYIPGDDIIDEIGDVKFEFKRPKPSERWAVYKSPATGPNVDSDLFVLCNVRDDAYIAVQSYMLDAEDDVERDVLAKFRKSELVSLLSKTKGKLSHEGTIVEPKKAVVEGKNEIILDIRLGGIDRRCIIIYDWKKNQRVKAFIGCTRRAVFERWEQKFHDAYETLKVAG